MWNEQKRSRFEDLRTRQEKNTLSIAEQAELTLLIEELEAAEACYRTPATERLQQERETLESQNRALATLALSKESLVQRLRDFLAEARAERQAIEGEVTAVLTGGSASCLRKSTK